MSKAKQELPNGDQTGVPSSTDDPASRVKKVFADFDESEVAQAQTRKKSWFDIKNTPCARNALIHGILGGFGTGLLYYLKSNVVLRSCDFAVYGFIIFTYGSWRVCRYQIEKQHQAIKDTVIKMNEMKDRQLSQTPPPTEEGGTT